jgi:exodeoxyribonuclease VII small subunit
MKPATIDIKTLSFEQALKELEAIVSQLEKGQIDLENAIESYTRGSALRIHCEQKLNEAKLKIEKLSPTQE